MLGPLMLDIASTTLSQDEAALLGESEVGGLILFGRNVESPEQVKALVEEIRSCQPEILIAVDQEGGRVQRLRNGFERLPSLQCIGDLAAKNTDQASDIAQSLGWLMAAEVLSMGIDFSFAPVLDVDLEYCSVIADRSFSDDPEICSALARSYIDGMHAAGMAATAKHFPGHGGVHGDSHLELPVDQRSMPELELRDLKPFSALSQHYDAVMPGHLLFPAIDEFPVGFSKFWLQDVLRQKLGFNGVIFSDDLSMQGAAESGSYSDRAQLALNAGCDMVLVCNNPDGAKEVLRWLQSNPRQCSTRLQEMRSRRQWDVHTIRADSHHARALSYIEQIQSSQ